MTRGEIWWADFGIPFGSEPGFRRPVLIVQDDSFNSSRINTVVVIPFTTNLLYEKSPGNVFVKDDESGLSKDSVIVVSQINAIDRKRLVEKVGSIKRSILEEVVIGLKMVLAIGN
jgi:mRNA interferase MazF